MVGVQYSRRWFRLFHIFVGHTRIIPTERPTEDDKMMVDGEQWKAALLMRLDRTETVELGTSDATVAAFVAELVDDGVIVVEAGEGDTVTVQRA
jgi:hypothetical protein